ncbi:fungal specific transcription factor domain [Trichoderma cornu-damae]|uniref:Fungal specific transcription factor domain n=1 Tax=Trichoderma cornu-damae TaxID=654480 RepID=A0A9P8U0E2_9HYPO|nr:fungal specific transcription factor domain [Trichoderma cornu-damae]
MRPPRSQEIHAAKRIVGRAGKNPLGAAALKLENPGQPVLAKILPFRHEREFILIPAKGFARLRILPKELESLVAKHVSTLPPQLQSTSASSSRSTGSLSMPRPSGAFYPAALRFQKLFLDTDIQTRPDAPPPPSSDMIPPAVMCYLGDQTQSAVIMSQYFQTVHKWMPIVSRVRLGSLANLELGSRSRADFALLLLAMKLIQDVPENSSSAVRDPLYICAKEFAASLDIAGVYTLLKLQANLLIAVYEMGHGIFPAAYVSMGYCVTQATALGIHNREAPQILEQPRTWVDWEERQRTWWLVVILERYVASVGENRPLLSADPKTTSHLPVSDDAWDSGEAMYPERLILSSPKHLSASPFARLAQASHLQGEVIKHCNDEAESLAGVQSEVEMLSQALLSFLEVISKDTASMMHFYSAVGVCLR